MQPATADAPQSARSAANAPRRARRDAALPQPYTGVNSLVSRCISRASAFSAAARRPRSLVFSFSGSGRLPTPNVVKWPSTAARAAPRASAPAPPDARHCAKDRNVTAPALDALGGGPRAGAAAAHR